MELESILQLLSQKRPIFHSEADFQQALAWELQQHWPQAAVRLEYKPKGIQSRIHLDIWAAVGGKNVAIELKYKTKRLEVELEDEHFLLAEHSAQDCGRYDFLKDIQRLEQVVAGQEDREGYAIFITNDSGYWTEGQAESPVDLAFRLAEGREITGELCWGRDASEGTIRGREQAIALEGSYQVQWKPYSSFEQARGDFRYLLMKITRKPPKTEFAIEPILARLAQDQPLLQSQADMRKALTHVLEQMGNQCLQNALIGETEKTDIRFETAEGQLLAIEVRYKTAALSVETREGRRELKKQAAQDISRYDFLQDVAKLERAVMRSSHLSGYAILITNDHTYWEMPKREGTADACFRIHEGKVLHGSAAWGKEASPGTMHGREEALYFHGTYRMAWRDFATIDSGKNGQFRVLVVKVAPSVVKA